jgi:hypothetical protein
LRRRKTASPSTTDPTRLDSSLLMLARVGFSPRMIRG